MTEMVSDRECLLHAFLDDAPVYFQVTDAAGTILAVSGRLAHRLQPKDGKLVGRQSHDLFAPKSAQTVARLGTRLRKDRAVQDESVTFCLPDGSLLPVSWSARITGSDARADMRVVSVFTERSGAEVGDATPAPAQGMATSELLNGVSLGLNNFLMVIQGSLEMIREQSDDSMIDLFVNDAMMAISRSTQVTSQLLAMANPTVLTADCVDLHGILNEVGQSIHKFVPKTVTIESSLEASLIPDPFDSAQLAQVVTGLLTTIAEAVPSVGTMRLETEDVSLDSTLLRHVGRAARPGAYIMISVSDVTFRTDFDPFPASASTTARIAVGEFSAAAQRSLAMAETFMHQSNGVVLVSGNASNGRTISLLLPAQADAELLPALNDAPSAAGNLRAVPLAPAATVVTVSEAAAQVNETDVLLVEEQSDVRDGLTGQLRSEGLQVQQAKDGDAALCLLRDGVRPRVLITNAEMCGTLQGPDLAEMARALLPNLRVIYVKDFFQRDLFERLQPNDIQLMRPVGGRTFVRTVREMLDD